MNSIENFEKKQQQQKCVHLETSKHKLRWSAAFNAHN